MQTLETREIVEPAGWMLTNVKLTARGRKKVADAFEWHYEGGAKIDYNPKIQFDPDFSDKYVTRGVGSVENWIDDIESDALCGLEHPTCEMNGEVLEFIEGVDYVLEWQSEEAFDLERIANALNEVHEVMQQEMTRLGW